MIAPRSRLLFWVAAIVLPFALVAAVQPAAMGLALLFIGLLAFVAVADALGTSKCLAGISVSLPAVVHLSKDHGGTIEVRIRNERQRQRTLRIALGLPGEILAAKEILDVLLPAQVEWSRLAWSCMPVERGTYPLSAAYLEDSSPLGFWAIRKTIPVQSEIRVYPNLFKDRKHLAALFLHRGAFGLHPQRQVGKGREFEKLREYVPGDSFDEIHWKATARRGRPITKVFQIERTQEVYVILDASRLAARKVSGIRCQVSGGSRSASRAPDTWHPTPDTSTLERYITAALVLGLAAEQQGDLFGLLTFSDRVDRFVRARNGKMHFSTCRDALYTLQPKTVSPDFDEVCTFIRLRLRRRALLVFLTALDDPALAESFVRDVGLIRRQHLIVVNMLQPAWAAPLFTNPNLASMDELYGHLAGHLRWQQLRELETLLRRRGVQFSLLNHERLSAELVSQYLGVKQRQLI